MIYVPLFEQYNHHFMNTALILRVSNQSSQFEEKNCTQLKGNVSVAKTTVLFIKHLYVSFT